MRLKCWLDFCIYSKRLSKMLKLSLCNELLADEGLTFNEQCILARELGYYGLEIAPGTLGVTPHTLPTAARQAILEITQSHNLQITGLHWLLAAYPQLSITEKSAKPQTQKTLIELVNLCSDLGGKIMVHGSPAQRKLPNDISAQQNLNNVIEFFKPIAERAEIHNIIYCIEPLSPSETDFVNSIEQGAEIAESIGSDFFKTMIDTSAAGQSEAESVANLICKWVPTGLIGHIHLNDTNRGAPGTGNDPFHDIVTAIKSVNWVDPIGVEPFTTCYNAVATAAIGKATIDAHFCGGAS